MIIGLDRILTFFIAAVWFVNGLLCKVLDFVPRHRQIVARILGEDYSRELTVLIGFSEIVMAVLIISGFKRKLCTLTQILVVAAMNLLEFLLVPDSLLWGRLNAVFAVLFIILVYCHGFVLGPNSTKLTRHA